METSYPYDRFFRSARLRPTTQEGRDINTEVQSDHARIVTSSSFRRLQTKAQVFSLEENAAVRTRLTHTLEVAGYGRWVAQDVAKKLAADGKLDPDHISGFVTTVENACLLHDLGNPPFGHLGEYAIRDWFANEKRKKELVHAWSEEGIAQPEIDTHYLAFEHFDGNPQGLRIVTRLQWLEDEFGLNLTNALLASTLKYLVLEPETGKEPAPFAKKIGFFATERERVLEVWKSLGLNVEKGTPAQRFPLAFLMEAADDIAYCVSDIEDALEKGIVRQGDLLGAKLPKALERFLPGKMPKEWDSYEAAKNAEFIRFKMNVIRYLAEAAERVYLENHDAIMNGAFSEALLDADELAAEALDYLKGFTRKHVFSSREAVDVEMSGFRIIQTLLDQYHDLLTLPKSAFERMLPYQQDDGSERDRPKKGEKEIEQRLTTLLPHKHFMCYKHAVSQNPTLEPIYRAHLVVDYIAGMTDSHSVKVFSVLTGTRAGLIL